MLNVTDLSSYLYCPRKFYLQKIKGIKLPPTKPMIEGLIRHEVVEKFANNEKYIILNFTQKLEKQDIVNSFQNLLNNLNEIIIEKHKPTINRFAISSKELIKKINIQMRNDFQLRAIAISNTMDKGFLSSELWTNLKPKYISEMRLKSEKLGLKGRADRVMIADETIIPFELKTRAVEKIYPSDEIQLTSYAMLLEEKYNTKIPLAILESGNTKHELTITNENKNKVIELIKEINNLIEQSEQANPKFPNSFSKCQGCELEEECANLGS